MQRLVEEHLDEIEAIEKKAFDQIDKLISAMSIDKIIDDTQGTLSAVAVEVESILKEIQPEAATHGVEYGKKIAEKIE